MPSILRSRIALFAMLGIFLIPIATSSLRGLTHTLTCEEEVATPFTLLIPPKGGEPVLASSTGRITREKKETLCEQGRGEGLTIDMGAKSLSETRVAMVVPITNRSDLEWRGTVKLIFDRTSIPIDIGAIPAGETVTKEVPFNLDPGEHQINGSLLIGP